MARWFKRLVVPGGLVSVVGLVAVTQPVTSVCSGTALAASGMGGNVWEVRASQEASSSGNGWTELSTNGNAAAATGRPRTATGSGGWDFATLGRTYPHGTMLKIRNPANGRSGVWPLTDVGDGSSFAPAIGLTPNVSTALGWTGGVVDISMADGSSIALASGFGKLIAGTGGFAASVSAPCGMNVSSGGGNPAPGATWGRLDMGFDGNYDMKQGAHAPYSGTIHIPGIAGWPGQGVYFYIVNDNQTGPDYTRAMYFAEGAAPIVANGAHVVMGQQIGSPVASGGDGQPGNFEIGPASVTNGDCLAKQYGLGSVAARKEILAFYAWMRTLGAGASNNTSNAGAP